MTDSSATYIDVAVAGYRLALPSGCLGGVLTDVLTDATAPFRGEHLPLMDLAAVFAGERRMVAPFAVVVDSRGQRVMVGLDTVSLQRVRASAVPVPKLGLLRPDLFEGALRIGGDLVLVLAPRSLVTL